MAFIAQFDWFITTNFLTVDLLTIIDPKSTFDVAARMTPEIPCEMHLKHERAALPRIINKIIKMSNPDNVGVNKLLNP